MKQVTKAIQFANEAHAGQLRKGTSIPYIFHVVNVGKILSEHHCDETEIIAGILHDTIEDTAVTYKEIEEGFGSEVFELVKSASEPNRYDSWKDRKRLTIERAETKSLSAIRVSCADKLDNISAIERDYNELGDALWSRFNATKEQQKWYYTSLAEVYHRRLSGKNGYPIALKLKSIVDSVFNGGNS